MEIGDQRIDAGEAIAGEDEDLGFAGEWSQLAVHRGTFQRAHHRRTDRYHPATRLARAVNLLDHPCTYVEPFAVHFVVRKILRAHRLERARADMQGHVSEIGTQLAHLLQQWLVEM